VTVRAAMPQPCGLPRLLAHQGSQCPQQLWKLPDVADEEYVTVKFFPRAQPVRADENGAHAVGERPDDIAGEAVADKQRLFRRGSGGGGDEPVEKRVRLAC